MNTKRYILFIIVIIIGLASTTCEGPVGPMGPQGPQGEQGPPGPVGPAGTDGSIILAGQGAPDENTGKPGDFYLDLATGNLYGPKMVEGWGTPTNLQGPQGPQGPAGPQGPPGEDGEDGQDGQDGQDGEDGEDGKDGKDGEDGKDGKDGDDGQDGEDGKDGSRIYAGNGAPDNSLGKKGDYYLDKTNYDLYGPKTGSGWGVPVNLQGPQGDQGPAGPPGTNGVSGWERVGGGCKSVMGGGSTAQAASCPAGKKVLGGGLAAYGFNDDTCSGNPVGLSTITMEASAPYNDTEWYVGFSFNSSGETYYQVWAICAIVN